MLLNFPVLFLEEMIAALNRFPELITFNNRNFEVYSAKLDDVVNVHLVSNSFGFKLSQDIID